MVSEARPRRVAERAEESVFKQSSVERATPVAGGFGRIRRNPFVVTGWTVLIAALANVLCYKILASFAPAQMFYEYSSSRRIIAFLLPLLVLGFGVNIPLRLSKSADRVEGLRLVWLQFCLAGGLTALLALVVGLSSEETIEGLLAGLTKSDVLALLVAALTLNGTAIIYSYYRGLHDFRTGARLNSLSNGLFPVAATLLFAFGTSAIFLTWSVLNLVAISVVAFLRVRPSFGPIPKVGQLLATAVGRVPGDVAFAGLFLLPVLQAHGRGSTIDASVFNYAFVLLGMIVTAASPISIVLLPQVGSLVARSGTAAARPVVIRATALAVGAGAVGVTVLLALPHLITRLLMSSTYESASGIVASIAPAIFGLALFTLLKSIVDGLNDNPLTSYLCVAAVAVYLVISLLGPPTLMALVLATDVALVVLGACTLALAVLLSRRRAGT